MRAVMLVAGLGLLTIGAAPPAAPGTVTIALADASDPDADKPFADAVGQALGDANFVLLPDHGRYVAEVRVSRDYRGIVTQRVAREPAAAGIGSWGPTISVPLGSKKRALRDLVATTLTVQLVTRATHAPVWTGSAMTADVDGAPVATKLARAALATYPQTIDRPISVP